MQYAILGQERESVRGKLKDLGRTIEYEDFANGIYVGVTDANLLEMKQVFAEIREGEDVNNCAARIYKKERQFKEQIRRFLMEEDEDEEEKKLKVVIMEG